MQKKSMDEELENRAREKEAIPDSDTVRDSITLPDKSIALNQVEADLKNSEANLYSPINNRNESIWSIDTNYNYLIFNEFFKNEYFAAFNLEIKKGVNALNILSPELKHFWKLKYDQALAGEHVVFEFSNPISNIIQYYEIFLNPILSETQISGVSALSLNITDRKQAEEDQKKHTTEQSILLDVSQQISTTLDLEIILQTVSDGTSQLFGIETTAIYLLEGQKLFLGATTPALDPGMPEGLRWAELSDHPNIQRAIATLRPVTILDTKKAKLSAAEHMVVEMRSLVSLLYLPFQHHENVTGVLILGISSQPRKFSRHELDICKTITNQLTLGIVNARLFTQINRYAKDLELQAARRREDELVLKMSEANLSALINGRDESIWSLDKNFNYDIFNDFFKADYQSAFNIELKRGMNALDILSPELRAFWEPLYTRALKGEQVVCEFSDPSKQSTRFYEITLNPIFTDNQISGVSALSVDITERKQNADTLLKNSANMSAIMENTQDSIWTINTAYEIVYVNSVFARDFYSSFGVHLEPGINLLQSLPEPLRPIWKARYDRTLANERFELIDEIDIVTKTIYIEVSFNPITFNNEVVGASFFGRDITDRRKAEESRLALEQKLLHTQKLESLGVLAGGIAHDFNNILMGILGYADLALSELDSFTQAREYVQGIKNSSRKAADLIKQMLAYSGKGKFSLEPVNLNHLIQDTAQMLAISISKNVLMRFNYSSEPVFLEGDPSQIRQVIMNMVINASDAIGKKSGVIALTTGSMYCDREYIESTGFEAQIARKSPIPEGMYLFLEVSDTGTGIPKDILDRIFEPFYSTKFTGRGLGLSAVLGIVNGHRGMVKIYSEVGKGTTFKVLFPLYKDIVDNTSPIDVSLNEDKDWQGQGTFLIADDEEAVRTVGKHMIKKLGYDVLTADDGAQAIELFREHGDKIVGVLLDLTMPHKDGAQVFREIRAIKPGIKVILSSGYNEQDATQQFVGKGLAGFIQKPYTNKELVQKIQEVMGKDSP